MSPPHPLHALFDLFRYLLVFPDSTWAAKLVETNSDGDEVLGAMFCHIASQTDMGADVRGMLEKSSAYISSNCYGDKDWHRQLYHDFCNWYHAYPGAMEGKEALGKIFALRNQNRREHRAEHHKAVITHHLNHKMVRDLTSYGFLINLIYCRKPILS